MLRLLLLTASLKSSKVLKSSSLFFSSGSTVKFALPYTKPHKNILFHITQIFTYVSFILKLKAKIRRQTSQNVTNCSTGTMVFYLVIC